MVEIGSRERKCRVIKRVINSLGKTKKSSPHRDFYDGELNAFKQTYELFCKKGK